MRVFGAHALRNGVAHHKSLAAIGKLQLVAGRAVCAVNQTAVEDVAQRRPAFQQVANVRMVKIAVNQREPGNLPRIQVVVAAVWELVVGKFAVVIPDCASNSTIFAMLRTQTDGMGSSHRWLSQFGEIIDSYSPIWETCNHFQLTTHGFNVTA